MKYKNEKIQILVMIVLLLTVIIGFFGYQLYEVFYWDKSLDEWFQSSAFIVFFALLNSRLGSIALILIPIIIIYGTCYSFHEKYYSGIFQDMVMRMGYKKAVKKELFSASKKAFIFPIIMFILFIIALITGPGISLDCPPSSSFLTLPPWGNDLVYQCSMVLFVLLCEWLFSIFIIFITFLITLIFKKFYLVAIYTFIIVNIFNYLIGLSAPYIEKIIHIYPENVYELMMTDSIPRALVTMLFCLSTMFVIFYVVYKNKDLVMLRHD